MELLAASLLVQVDVVLVVEAASPEIVLTAHCASPSEHATELLQNHGFYAAGHDLHLQSVSAWPTVYIGNPGGLIAAANPSRGNELGGHYIGIRPRSPPPATTTT